MASPENGNLPNKQHEQSQQAAPPMTFEAATAVLDTNELLHLIIAEVPRENRTSLRSVSKNWQAAVLKLGHVIDLVEDGYDGYRQCTNVPVYYLPEKTLKCNESNPVLDCYTKSVQCACASDDLPTSLEQAITKAYCDGYSGTSVDIYFYPEKPSGTPDGVGRDNEFITDLPVKMVFARARAYHVETRGQDRGAVLHAPGGIRVRHVRKCFEMMQLLPGYSYSKVVRFGLLKQESGGDGESGKGALANDKAEEELENWPKRSQGGHGDSGEDELEKGSKRSRSDDGESGEGGLANDEAEVGHEWDFEVALVKWSKGSQGDHSELREGGSPSEEPEDGFEWNAESEQQYWSNLPGDEPR
jgi:hypothetical protein